MQFNIIQRLTAYIGPWEPLSYAIKYFFETILKGFSGAQDRTFAAWYTNLGHHLVKMEADTPVPRIVALASGTVLELGPAVGNQLPRFNAHNITHIYGVEPNDQLFDVLKAKVVDNDDLRDKYTPIHGTLEDDALFGKYGIVPNSMDTVVSIQVLCSVEDAEEAARRIHRLLKPGGKLVFWEHRRSEDAVTRVVQRIWGLLWSPLLGGCRLTRDVEAAIMSAGPWEVEELARGETLPYSLLPRVWGSLVKVEG